MTTLSDKLFGTFLGIEFQGETIVITSLKSSIKGVSLLASSSFPLKNDEASMTEVSEYIKHQTARPDKIFVSIPDKWTITKFISIPYIKGKGVESLDSLMRYEIERHIPYNIEEVAYDFLVIDVKDAAYCILFVVVHKEKMEYIRKYLENLALRPDSLIPSSTAVLNTIELSGVSAGGLHEIIGIRRKSKIIGKHSKANISIYFDRLNASVSVLKNGQYVYQRLFPVKPEEKQGEFLNEISQSMTEVQSRYQIDGFNSVILAGDMSSVPEIADGLKERMGTQVITLDKISDFAGKRKRAEINMLASSIGACFAGLGLATYKINLLPHKKEYEKGKAVPLSTRTFLVLILVLVVGIFSTEALKRKKYLTNIDEEIKKNEPLVASVEKLSGDIAGLQGKIDLLNKLKKNEIALELLSEASVMLPKDAWITNFEYKVTDGKDKKKGIGEVVLSGFASSSSSLIPILEDAPYFEKVSFIGPVKKVGDKEQFKLGASVTLLTQPETVEQPVTEENPDVAPEENGAAPPSPPAADKGRKIPVK